MIIYINIVQSTPKKQLTTFNKNRNDYKVSKINLSNKFNLFQYLILKKKGSTSCILHKQKNQGVTPKERPVKKIRSRLNFLNQNNKQLVKPLSPHAKRG
jgi:hypothetical protein